MAGQFKLVLFFSAILVISVTAFNYISPDKSNFRHFFSYLAYPVIFVNHQFKNICARQIGWLNDRELKNQNDELQALVLDLQAQNIVLQAELSYISQHQELIEFHKRYNFEHNILAQVFFKKINSQEHYMLFNKGLLDGVQPNMVAIYKNHILGKVVAVYPKYCQVDLVTSKSCKIAVYSLQTGAVGICCGHNDPKTITLSYVSHLQKLAPGDMLISSGEGIVFPSGFNVGKVANFCENGMYYSACALLPFDLEMVGSCYLIAANQS